MPYNPAVNDIRGQILAQGIIGAANAQATGITNSALLKAQGMQTLGEGLGKGISSLGSSIAGGIEGAGSIYAKNQLQDNTNAGKLAAYQQLKLLTPQQADEISALNNRDKISGALAIYDGMMQQQIANNMAIKRAQALRNLELETNRAGEVGTAAIPIRDANGNIIGQKPVPTFRTSDQSVQLLQEKEPPAPEVRNTQQGVVRIPPTGYAEPVMTLTPQGPVQLMPPSDPQQEFYRQALQNMQGGGTLGGAGGSVVGPGGAVVAPGAAAAPQPNGQPAQGGYKIGTRYNGMTYLGGDPNVATNWAR